MNLLAMARMHIRRRGDEAAQPDHEIITLARWWNDPIDAASFCVYFHSR